LDTRARVREERLLKMQTAEEKVMKPITVWEKWEGPRRAQRLEHNHIEDGHSERLYPEPHTPEQRASWGGQTWVRTHAYLDNGRVRVPLSTSKVTTTFEGSKMIQTFESTLQLNVGDELVIRGDVALVFPVSESIPDSAP
jgi:hypothetical protein